MITTDLPAAASRLLQSPIGRTAGVAVLDALPDQIGSALLQEAMAIYPSADRQDVPDGDNAAGRGGTPARHLYTAGGGPVQDSLYTAPWLSEYLSSLCGVAITPAGTRGSFSYYIHDGDYLGLHLDIETCDVTLITTLRDDAGPNDSSGALLLHIEHLGSNLHAVRHAPQQGLCMVKAIPGQSVLLLGGLLPHETVPITPGGSRIISALCFTAT